jgi:hypothetical protein
MYEICGGMLQHKEEYKPLNAGRKYGKNDNT